MDIKLTLLHEVVSVWSLRLRDQGTQSAPLPRQTYNGPWWGEQAVTCYSSIRPCRVRLPHNLVCKGSDNEVGVCQLCTYNAGMCLSGIHNWKTHFSDWSMSRNSLGNLREKKTSTGTKGKEAIVAVEFNCQPRRVLAIRDWGRSSSSLEHYRA